MRNILVYQMGRVGSVAVRKALNAAGVQAEHVHYLHYGGEYSASPRNRDLLHTIQAAEMPWNVVSLVRNPIERNLSEFIRTLQTSLPSDKEVVMHNFVNKYNHMWPLIWFDMELNKTFNIDIYSMPFNKKHGWSTYNYPGLNLLIIQLEKLDKLAAKAFNAWIGLKNFSVPIYNSTIAPRSYYRDYIKKNLTLNDTFLNFMYNSKYVKHFYSQEDIERMKASPFT